MYHLQACWLPCPGESDISEPAPICDSKSTLSCTFQASQEIALSPVYITVVKLIIIVATVYVPANVNLRGFCCCGNVNRALGPGEIIATVYLSSLHRLLLQYRAEC